MGTGWIKSAVKGLPFTSAQVITNHLQLTEQRKKETATVVSLKALKLSPVLIFFFLEMGFLYIRLVWYI